eukprot:Opistho-2@33240
MPPTRRALVRTVDTVTQRPRPPPRLVDLPSGAEHREAQSTNGSLDAKGVDKFGDFAQGQGTRTRQERSEIHTLEGNTWLSVACLLCASLPILLPAVFLFVLWLVPQDYLVVAFTRAAHILRALFEDAHPSAWPELEHVVK